MARKSSKKTAVVTSGTLYTDDEYTGMRLSSSDWVSWLSLGITFYYECSSGGFTVRSEQRRQGLSWYAFKKINGRLQKVYVGRSAAVRVDRLEYVGSCFKV
jgi:hypothetical protein